MITRVWINDDATQLAVELDEGDGGLFIVDQGSRDTIDIDELDLAGWDEVHPK